MKVRNTFLCGSLLFALLLPVTNATAQEIYFSISGKSSTIISGDDRNQYDYWIKPIGNAEPGELQIYDAGLGGRIDVAVKSGVQPAGTMYSIYEFDAIYEKTANSIREKSNIGAKAAELVAVNEDEYKNRWATAHPLSPNDQDGYLVRVSASEGGGVNNFSLRVTSQSGKVISGDQWQIIAVDLSIGLYRTSINTIYQLKPYFVGAANSQELILDGEEDTIVKKIDSFGKTYDLSDAQIPATVNNMENKWGLYMTGSAQWLNTLTVYGTQEPMLWIMEPKTSKRIEFPEISITEVPPLNCTTKTFDLRGVNLSGIDLTKAEWFMDNILAATGKRVELSFSASGDYNILALIAQSDNYYPEFWKAELDVTVSVSPKTRLEAAKTIVAPNEIVVLSAEKSRDPEDRPLQYSWFVNGIKQEKEGSTFEFSGATSGIYNIIARSSTGGTSACENDDAGIRIRVNELPVAAFTVPEAIIPGTTLTADGSASYDNDGEIISYNWLLNDEELGADKAVEITLDDAGTHLLSLIVQDNSGSEEAIDTLTQEIRVNAPPVPLWKTVGGKPLPGQNVTFSAEDSYDPDGTIVEYIWDFGDGEELYGREIVHNFDEGGDQDFILTVVDNDNLPNSRVSVEANLALNHQPYIVTETLIHSNSLYIPLSAAGSYDLDGDPLKYLWTLPDGTQRQEESFTYKATEPGVHIIGLTLDDGLGLKNSVNTETVQIIINQPVKAIVEPEILACAGQTVLFNSSQSFDPDGDPFSATWDFGNGIISDEANPSYIYEKPGIYEAKLTLNDGYSDYKTITKIPVIIEDSPIAKFSISDTTICINSSITFDGTASSDPSGALPAFSWDTGDGKTDAGPIINHVYTEPGTYVITLSIQGSGSGRCGNISQASATITVTEGPEANFEIPEWTVPGETVTLDGSNSKVPDGIKSAVWIIENEQMQDSVSGINSSYKFTQPGEYFVTLELVTNSQTTCNSVSSTKMIKVNSPPVISWNMADKVAAGTELLLDATESYDPDGFVRRYKWYLNGKVISENAGEAIQIFERGKYTVKLEITDNSSAANNTVSAEKTFQAVGGPNPIIKMGTASAYPSQKVSFSAAGNTDAEGKKVTTRWFVNNVETDQTNFIAEENTIYRITLLQDNGLGLSNSADSSVVVFNPTPFPVIEPDFPTKIAVNGTLSLDDYGIGNDWQFKTGSGNKRVWTAKELGLQTIAAVWLLNKKEMHTRNFEIEVVESVQFLQQSVEKEVGWNPDNPEIILKAPDINAVDEDIEYEWKKDGEVIGTGDNLTVTLSRGENVFLVSATAKEVNQSKPALATVIIHVNQ